MSGKYYRNKHAHAAQLSVAELQTEAKRLLDNKIHGLSFSPYIRACSSVGRATALQAEGQEFDSPQVHII